jgi:hypothetical protein
MGCTLSLENIKTGDMVLISDLNYFGKVIKFSTRSEITHAGIFVNANELTSEQKKQLDITYDVKNPNYIFQCCVDDNFKASVNMLQITDRYLMDRPSIKSVHVRRLKTKITSPQINDLVNIYVEFKTKTEPVSFMNVLKILLYNYGVKLPNLITSNPNLKFVCSTFVAYVYDRLQILKCNDWFLISPKMLSTLPNKTIYGNTNAFSDLELIEILYPN